MKNIDNLAELRAEIQRARSQRDRAQVELRGHLALMNDARARGILLRDAMGDALRTWRPFKLAHEALHGRISGEAVAAVGMAAASFQGTWKKRMLWSGASWLLGRVIGDDPLKRTSILDNIGNALHRAREVIKPSEHTKEEREL